MLGPLEMLHAPVPTTGAFAAKIAEVFEQIVCGEPALDTVGGALTVMVTFEVEGVHGALLIVHVNT